MDDFIFIPADAPPCPALHLPTGKTAQEILRGFSACGVESRTIESTHTMKKLKNITAITLAVTFLAAPITGFAADKKEKAKPYPLDKCLISDEALDSMGKPFVFVHEGQEIKLCCKSCQKDFNKDKAKYIKKLKEAEAKAKAKAKK
jgi:hypothetical protein